MSDLSQLLDWDSTKFDSVAKVLGMAPKFVQGEGVWHGID